MLSTWYVKKGRKIWTTEKESWRGKCSDNISEEIPIPGRP